MNFRPELVEKILTGAKTQTRRVVSPNERSPWFIGECGLRVGQDYAVCPGRGKTQVARLTVKRVWQELAGEISEVDATREGFADRADFIAYWERLHGSFDPTTRVWAIQFELVATA